MESIYGWHGLRLSTTENKIILYLLIVIDIALKAERGVNSKLT